MVDYFWVGRLQKILTFDKFENTFLITYNFFKITSQ